MKATIQDEIRVIYNHLSGFTRDMDEQKFGVFCDGIFENHATYVEGIATYLSYLLLQAPVYDPKCTEFFTDFMGADLPEGDLEDMIADWQMDADEELFPYTKTLESFIAVDNCMLAQGCYTDTFQSFSMLYVSLLDLMGALFINENFSWCEAMGKAHQKYITSLQEEIRCDLTLPQPECQDAGKPMLLN